MPRVRVGALLLLKDKVVVVRHRVGDRTYHLLPGGGVDYGETLADALIREVEEETGLVCRIVRPILINDTIAPPDTPRRRHVVNITFLCEVIGGSVTTEPNDPRVEAVELIDVAALADLDLRPPLAEALINALESNQTLYLGPLWREES